MHTVVPHQSRKLKAHNEIAPTTPSRSSPPPLCCCCCLCRGIIVVFTAVYIRSKGLYCAHSCLLSLIFFPFLREAADGRYVVSRFLVDALGLGRRLGQSELCCGVRIDGTQWAHPELCSRSNCCSSSSTGERTGTFLLSKPLQLVF